MNCVRQVLKIFAMLVPTREIFRANNIAIELSSSHHFVGSIWRLDCMAHKKKIPISALQQFSFPLS